MCQPEGGDDFRIRPLYRRVTEPSKQAVEHQFLWPFGRVRTDPEESFQRLFPLWSWHQKETVEGERRAVLVSGEPGIGKTRLVSELVRYAHEIGATVLWGRCDEELNVPFEPFAEALRHYVACVPADRVRAELGTLGGELARMLPDLPARVPGLTAPRNSVRTRRPGKRWQLCPPASPGSRESPARACRSPCTGNRSAGPAAGR